MKLSAIAEVLNAKIVCGFEKLDLEVDFGFASDLMSDVLTVASDDIILITGLANMQTIRTAEMSDIGFILFVRNKKATEEMIMLAEENNIAMLECSYSMFKTCGILFNAGVKPVY